MTLAAGILFAVASVIPARAQNLDWAGLYVGAGAGYGWGTAAPDTSGSPDLKTSGVMGDVLVGYNLQVDNVVFGPEISVAVGDAKGEIKDGGYLTYDGRSKALSTFAGRLGLAFGRFLPYAKGGAAIAEMQSSLSCPAGAAGGVCKFTGPFSSSVTASKWGWALGGGIEVALDGARNWSAFADYMHYDFGAVSVTYVTPVGAVTGQSNVTFDIVQAGVKYHF
jgi:outer membrane immunogenic protein